MAEVDKGPGRVLEAFRREDRVPLSLACVRRENQVGRVGRPQGVSAAAAEMAIGEGPHLGRPGLELQAEPPSRIEVAVRQVAYPPSEVDVFLGALGGQEQVESGTPKHSETVDEGPEEAIVGEEVLRLVFLDSRCRCHSPASFRG